MNIDLTTDLITTYLNQSYYLESQILIKDIKKTIKYRSLSFKYCGHDVVIHVHNNEFIEMKVNGKFGCVCDCIQQVRSEIDRLKSLRY